MGVAVFPAASRDVLRLFRHRLSARLTQNVNGLGLFPHDSKTLENKGFSGSVPARFHCFSQIAGRESVVPLRSRNFTFSILTPSALSTKSPYAGRW